jgi:hypothetical protein
MKFQANIYIYINFDLTLIEYLKQQLIILEEKNELI